MPAAAADVVIVGGGVMGTSIALQLARRRAGRIVLCEKHHVASGPTGRSSALLRRHYSIELYARMAARSFELYSNFEELTGRPAEITRCGLVMAVGPEDVAAMRDTVTMMRGLGVKVEELAPRDLARVVPGLAVDDFGAAAWETDTGYGDPASVSQAYAARARELGVTIRTGCEVVGLARTPEAVHGVVTREGEIAAPVVVVAAGAWSGVVGALAGVDIPVRPLRRSKFITAPFPFDRIPEATPFVIDPHQGISLRREGAGILLGIGRRDRAGDFDTALDWGLAEPLVERAVRRAPVLADAQLMRTWSGLYEMTPDQTGIVSAVPGVTGLHVVAGFSGHGFMHGPIAGQLMAELIVDGRATTVDATALGLERFARGETSVESLTFT